MTEEKENLPELPHDFVDHLIHEWHVVHPELDLEGVALVARLVRLSQYFTNRLDTNFDSFGTNRGEFEVLAALARHPETSLTPKEIHRKILVSSGGLSNRLRRLEEKGLIRRDEDPCDGRGVIVKLLPKGQRLVDKVLFTHVAIEKQLVQGLNAQEKEQLIAIMKKLLVAQPVSLNRQDRVK